MNNRELAKLLDRDTYIGKPCKYGHTLRSTNSGRCQDCKAITIRKTPSRVSNWAKVNRVKRNEWWREYRRQRLEKFKEYRHTRAKNKALKENTDE